MSMRRALLVAFWIQIIHLRRAGLRFCSCRDFRILSSSPQDCDKISVPGEAAGEVRSPQNVNHLLPSWSLRSSGSNVLQHRSLQPLSVGSTQIRPFVGRVLILKSWRNDLKHMPSMVFLLGNTHRRKLLARRAEFLRHWQAVLSTLPVQKYVKRNSEFMDSTNNNTSVPSLWVLSWQKNESLTVASALTAKCVAVITSQPWSMTPLQDENCT